MHPRRVQGAGELEGCAQRSGDVIWVTVDGHDAPSFRHPRRRCHVQSRHHPKTLRGPCDRPPPPPPPPSCALHSHGCCSGLPLRSCCCRQSPRSAASAAIHRGNPLLRPPCRTVHVTAQKGRHSSLPPPRLRREGELCARQACSAARASIAATRARARDNAHALLPRGTAAAWAPPHTRRKEGRPPPQPLPHVRPDD